MPPRAELNALMSTMVASGRPLALPFLQDVLRRHYGMEGELSCMTGERDQNVRVSVRSGEAFVLKIAHPEEPEAEADLARAALCHVAQSDPDLPCPRVVPSLQGETRIDFTDDRGAPRRAYLVTFLAGRTLASSPGSPGQRAACGVAGARLARALADFEHPGAHRALIWDVQQLHYVPLLLEEIEDFPDAARAHALLQGLHARLAGTLPALRTQVVHNDLNALNILVDPADATRITGLIDFGDAVHTVLVSDVAVIAAELIPEACAEPAEAAACVADVRAAYEAVLPLTAQERELLGPLVATRLVTNLVVQQWHRRRNPAGGHYTELAAQFICRRLDLAAALGARGPEG